MFGWRGLLDAILVVALAVAVAFIAKRVREQQILAEATVEDIEAQLNALDPVTRAAVIARLSADKAIPV